MTGDAGGVISDTAPLPPSLKKLQLDFYPSFHHDNYARYARYLRRYANHSQLKELLIVFDTSEDIDNVLEAILHLGQLQRLSIRIKGDWESTQMQGFLDGLCEACPNLSSLGINCNNAPSTHTMNALKRLEHLEEFGFSIEGMDDNDGFWHAIETFSQLKCIDIHPSKASNMHRRRYLHEQRPDLRITINSWLPYD